MPNHETEINQLLDSYVQEIGAPADTLVSMDITTTDADEDEIPTPLEPEDMTFLALATDPGYPDPEADEDDLDVFPGVDEYLATIQQEITKNNEEIEKDRKEHGCEPCSCLR